MEEPTFAAAIAALVSAIYAVLASHRKANHSDVAIISGDLRELREGLRECEKERDRLSRREIDLMRQLVDSAVKNGTRGGRDG